MVKQSRVEAARFGVLPLGGAVAHLKLGVPAFLVPGSDGAEDPESGLHGGLSGVLAIDLQGGVPTGRDDEPHGDVGELVLERRYAVAGASRERARADGCGEERCDERVLVRSHFFRSPWRLRSAESRRFARWRASPTLGRFGGYLAGSRELEGRRTRSAPACRCFLAQCRDCVALANSNRRDRTAGSRRCWGSGGSAYAG